MFVKKIGAFKASIEVDSDKSITHRALILGAAASGKTKIYNASFCKDCLSTINAIKSLKASFEVEKNSIILTGSPLLNKSKKPLSESNNYLINAENSGTTARLLMGLTSSIDGIRVTFTGDSSLSKRPMKRITDPLTMMGARFEEPLGNLPIVLHGQKLRGIDYELKVASAQVKSAILIAGLNAEGKTSLEGKINTRNHTEIMLKAMGANLKCDGLKLELLPSLLRGIDMEVGGDFSSAIYFLVLAILCKNSEICIKNVNINPTRIKALDVLKCMGANILISNYKKDIEESADITACSSRLSPFKINAECAAQMIDELPLFAVIACFLDGESIIEGAEELRYKESDRLGAIACGIERLGGRITATPSGLKILGRGELEGGVAVDSFCDHRIEMSLAVALALSNKGGEVSGASAAISAPSFHRILQGLQREIL